MLKDAPVTASLPAVDLERAKKFYGETLGFKAMHESENDASYMCGMGTGLYIYKRGATKADHTVASFYVEDIEAEMKDLVSRGVTFEHYSMPGLTTDENGLATWGNDKSAWFKDTEGNILGLFQKGK